MQLDANALPLLLSLDGKTGKVFWLPRSEKLAATVGFRLPARSIKIFNTQFAGMEAMTAVSKAGYKVGAIFGRNYYAHRVVWAMVHGSWPQSQIDHINGNRTDNRPQNIRLADQSQNNANARKRASATTSRFKGVSWNKCVRKWSVQTSHRNECRARLFFEDEIEAAKAYDAIAADTHGEFARTNKSLGLLE